MSLDSLKERLEAADREAAAACRTYREASQKVAGLLDEAIPLLCERFGIPYQEGMHRTSGEICEEKGNPLLICIFDPEDTWRDYCLICGQPTERK